MNTLKIFLIFFIIILFGCQENSIVDPEIFPTEDNQMEKICPNPNQNGAFQYLQQFLNVEQIDYLVDGTDVIVTINNRNIFNRGQHFFAQINYTSGTTMLYLNKPTTIEFIIPYYGSSDFVSLELYCVMEYEQ